MQSFIVFNVTATDGWKTTKLKMPNGIYRHHVVITDDKVRPRNKFNFKLFLELKVHEKKFTVGL